MLNVLKTNKNIPGKIIFFFYHKLSANLWFTQKRLKKQSCNRNCSVIFFKKATTKKDTNICHQVGDHWMQYMYFFRCSSITTRTNTSCATHCKVFGERSCYHLFHHESSKSYSNNFFRVAEEWKWIVSNNRFHQSGSKTPLDKHVIGKKSYRLRISKRHELSRIKVFNR